MDDIKIGYDWNSLSRDFHRNIVWNVGDLKTIEMSPFPVCDMTAGNPLSTAAISLIKFLFCGP